jgi:hypothetical protein
VVLINLLPSGFISKLDGRRARQRAHYHAHKNDPEFQRRNRERCKAYADRTREQQLRRYAEYRETHKDDPAYKTKARERSARWRDADPERARKASTDGTWKWRAEPRAKFFDMYGHACALCGFTDKRALSLDHIRGGGSREYKTCGPMAPYVRATREHQPDEFRTLCMNCQFITASEQRRARKAVKS